MNCSTATEESKNELLDVVPDQQLPSQINNHNHGQRRISNLLKKTLRADSSHSIKNIRPSFPIFDRSGMTPQFQDSSERISFGENYTPFKYPGSIEEALLHEEANILGETIKPVFEEQDSEQSRLRSIQQQFSIRDKSKCCPCCGKTVKDKKLTFFNFNQQCINEKYGGSLSYLFQVNKFFIITILVVILVYFIYFQIKTESLCQQIKDRTYNASSLDGEEETTTQSAYNSEELIKKDKEKPRTNPKCLTLFRMSVISEVQLRRQSDKDTQIMLADLKFILLLLLQVSNIFFFQSAQILKRMKKIKQETKLTKLRKKSIMVKYIPQFYTEDEIVKYLQLIVKNTYNVNVKIACITHIFNTYEKHKLIQQRMSLLQDIYRTQKPEKRYKLVDRLLFNYSQLKQISNEDAVFSGTLVITFLSEKDKILVYNLLQKSYFLSTVHKIKLMCKMNEDSSTRRIICEKAPELSEILWQNIGYQGRSKVQLSLLLIAFTLIIFIGLPRLTEFLYEWQFQSKNTNETISEKAIDYFISLLLFVISNMVWVAMKYLLTKSKQPTTIVESIYMVIANFAFHLQFYIIVPIFLAYFGQHLDEDKVQYDKLNIKVYGIVTLISVNSQLQLTFSHCGQFDIFYKKGFSGLSLVEVFLGPSFLLHRYKKWKTLRRKKQYFQERLNSIFERPSFPLEKRVLILYKSYTFGIIVSFICPLAWLYVLFGLIFHFIGNRMTIVYQYSLYTYCNHRIVRVATRIASISMMYVVTISYLLTEQLDGFYIREFYIQFAKYMLISNVILNTIFDNVYKAIKKRRKNLYSLQKKILKREESFEVAEEGNENLYAYYNKYQEILGKIHPSWSDEKVEEIIYSNS